MEVWLWSCSLPCGQIGRYTRQGFWSFQTSYYNIFWVSTVIICMNSGKIILEEYGGEKVRWQRITSFAKLAVLFCCPVSACIYAESATKSVDRVLTYLSSNIRYNYLIICWDKTWKKRYFGNDLGILLM